METLGIVVAALVLAGIFHLVFEKLKAKYRKEAQSKIEKLPEASAPSDLAWSLSQVQIKREDPAQKIISRLREKRDSGVDCKTALRAVIDEFPDEIEERIIGFTGRAGYPASEVLPIMAEWSYSANDVSDLLSKSYSLNLADSARALAKFFLTGTVEEKAKALVALFEDADDLPSLIPVLTEMGSSYDAIVDILNKDTELSFAGVVEALNIQQNASAIVSLAKTMTVDVTDSDTYRELREDANVSFEDAAQLLAKSGQDAKSILHIEGDYDSFDFDDDCNRSAIFDALRACGFSDREILEATDDITDSIAEVILTAVEAKVSLVDLGNFLRPQWAADLPGLWDALADCDGIPTEVAIEVMHSLIPPEKRYLAQSNTVPDGDTAFHAGGGIDE